MWFINRFRKKDPDSATQDTSAQTQHENQDYFVITSNVLKNDVGTLQKRYDFSANQLDTLITQQCSANSNATIKKTLEVTSSDKISILLQQISTVLTSSTA